MTHVEYVRDRFKGCPVYTNKRGDVLVDRDGIAIVATARECRANQSNEWMQRLWQVRASLARIPTRKFLGHVDFQLVTP